MGSSVPSGLLAPEYHVLLAMVGVTLIAGERAPAESDRTIALDELIRNDILIGCGCGLKREKRLSGDGKRFPTVRSQRRGQRSNHSLMSIVMLFTRWFETHSGVETDYLD